jgi:hypothetical protein
LFSKFEFVLFYELDAFVFRDELDSWCDANYDYIGAPWFEGFANCSSQSPFIGVGNGGFSLRKISSALRVLRSFSYVLRPHELLFGDGYYDKFIREKGAPARTWAELLKNLTFANNTFWRCNDFRWNEDLFWGVFVPRSFPWFRVAPFEKARKFSVEYNPIQMYKLNNKHMPFGCHAWLRSDFDFWLPHLLEHAAPTAQAGRLCVSRVGRSASTRPVKATFEELGHIACS